MDWVRRAGDYRVLIGKRDRLGYPLGPVEQARLDELERLFVQDANRRRAPWATREQIRAPISIVVQIGDWVGEARDISGDGLYVVTTAALPIGARTVVRVTDEPCLAGEGHHGADAGGGHHHDGDGGDAGEGHRYGDDGDGGVVGEGHRYGDDGEGGVAGEGHRDGGVAGGGYHDDDGEGGVAADRYRDGDDGDGDVAADGYRDGDDGDGDVAVVGHRDGDAGDGSEGHGSDGSEGHGGDGREGRGSDGSEGHGGDGSEGHGSDGSEGHGGDGREGRGSDGSEGHGGDGREGRGGEGSEGHHDGDDCDAGADDDGVEIPYEQWQFGAEVVRLDAAGLGLRFVGIPLALRITHGQRDPSQQGPSLETEPHAA